MKISVLDNIATIPKETWNRLVDDNDPFTTHSFLRVLEDSKSVHERTGWVPMHIAVWEQNELIAAMPLYLKNHSYGEYIFDWSWAEAAQQNNLPYYPKLLSAVPFTPATGNRLLLSDAESTEQAQMLIQGAKAVAQATKASSIHLLFTPKSHKNLLKDSDLFPRLSQQFHWTNPGCTSFEEWLALFRTKDRKKIRAERRKAQQSVESIYSVPGTELTEEQIESIWFFYQETCQRKWGRPYLTKAFFRSLNQELADISLVFFAENEGRIVASSLCFQRGQHLYGRYWGAEEFYDSLHFELCYHQPIQACLEHGWTRFEAGAQGEHKLKRGLLACETHSLHCLEHPGLHKAVEDFCQREALGIKQYITERNQHSPLKI